MIKYTIKLSSRETCLFDQSMRHWSIMKSNLYSASRWSCSLPSSVTTSTIVIQLSHNLMATFVLCDQLSHVFENGTSSNWLENTSVRYNLTQNFDFTIFCYRTHVRRTNSIGNNNTSTISSSRWCVSMNILPMTYAMLILHHHRRRVVRNFTSAAHCLFLRSNPRDCMLECISEW